MEPRDTRRLIARLDAVIVALMVAITVTLGWPVGRAFWQQRDVAATTTHVRLPKMHEGRTV